MAILVVIQRMQHFQVTSQQYSISEAMIIVGSVGTDSTENWTMIEFYPFCKQHFDPIKKKGWTFKLQENHPRKITEVDMGWFIIPQIDFTVGY